MLFRVLLTALLVILVMMWTVSSIPVCAPGCTFSQTDSECHVRHVSELHDSSIAPWSFEIKSSEELLKSVTEVKCNSSSRCGEYNMEAKPIKIEIMVFKRVRNGSKHHWCKCPYELPVGCTCVKKQ